MKRISIIGIGAGDPDYLTVQAINAMNRVDVFFIMDKGPDKAKLVELRTEICRRHITHDRYRFVEASSPEWTRDGPDYRATIAALNRDKKAIIERLIRDELADGERGGFLVWGDPTLYDSTIRIVAEIASGAAGDLEFEVIPGISSVQALAARHKVPLNRIGQPVEITTGRRLAEGYPAADSVAVMLDAEDTFKRFADQDIDICWGAYVGMAEEILIAGKLADVADEIARRRAEARRANGWIMDTYLMRRRGGDMPD